MASLEKHSSCRASPSPTTPCKLQKKSRLQLHQISRTRRICRPRKYGWIASPNHSAKKLSRARTQAPKGMECNSLTAIPSDIFSNLTSLTSLERRYGHCAYSAVSCLPQQRHIPKLHCHSRICRVRWPHKFGANVVAQRVIQRANPPASSSMSHNRLKSIPDEVFSGLASLEFLEQCSICCAFYHISCQPSLRHQSQLHHNSRSWRICRPHETEESSIPRRIAPASHASTRFCIPTKSHPSRLERSPVSRTFCP